MAHALPALALPPGETDAIAWMDALKNGWIVNAGVPLTKVQYLEQVTISPP